MHIQHIALNVNDLDESIEFYETVTELTAERRHKGGHNREVVFMGNKDGDTEIELVWTAEGQKFSGKGMFICFKTDKLEEKYKLVLDRGMKPSEILSPNEKTSYFYVYDPNGVSVQLRRYHEC